ncbi:type III restriction endonuclease subunit M [Clostridia bacterium]|nr:type III restriction endonuclease subunit M [Clostridia bacterium]
MYNHQTKSKQRVADHGEVFTAEREVNAMLDLVKQETERIDSRFLEPACGDGNFLAEILRRKLAVVKSRYGKNAADYERYAVIAVTSIYGVDILHDNVDECRTRMFGIFDKEYTLNCRKDANDETREAVRHILRHNILCGDALTLKTPDGEPIFFAEWSAVNGCLLKRRDFRLDEMLEGHEENLQTDLFSTKAEWEYDEEIQAFIPLPLREFAPKHYRRIVEKD